MLHRSSGAVRIVAIVAAARDRNSLRRIFQGFRWEGKFLRNCHNLKAALKTIQPDVVLTESAPNDGATWREVLDAAQEQASAPPVIVTSRLADERLWAEVLNLGGYDLLISSPYSPQEVHDVVSMACRSREPLQLRAAS